MRDLAKHINFRNPSDMLFYEYEKQRLKTDRKKWWKLPLPFLKKSVVPEPTAEADFKKKVEVAVNAQNASLEYQKKVKTQNEQFSKRHQEPSVIQ